MIIVWQFRKSGKPLLVALTGTTMGTTYSIKYFHPKGNDYQSDIDSILFDFNHSLSTYENESELSVFNRESTFRFDQPYFHEVLKVSKEVYQATGGAFDPTVYPLVSALGFGPENRITPDSAQVDSLLQFVGFSKIYFNQQSVSKERKDMKLDFSAIAKGYGVDVVGYFLQSQGIKNYFVEIGGEVKTLGLNDNKPWRVGIEDPTVSTNESKLTAIVELLDQSMATSGNYRNFYVLDGVKYGHTIHPGSGYPVLNSLLSASVFASSCMEADAYATSFMVLGIEESKIIVEADRGLEAVLIYEKNGQMETYISEGIADRVQLVGE